VVKKLAGLCGRAVTAVECLTKWRNRRDENHLAPGRGSVDVVDIDQIDKHLFSVSVMVVGQLLMPTAFAVRRPRDSHESELFEAGNPLLIVEAASAGETQ
jgi:hypothetical protein